MKPHRVGILGLHHDHVWGNLEELLRTGRAEIIGAADPYPELRERFQRDFGTDIPLSDSYDEVLSDDRLTAVYIFASNSKSADLAVQACERGLHCLVEKPMAATLEGADRMLAAAEANGVKLFVNWPFVWWPQLRQAIDMAASGAIGTLWQVKYRAAHQGPVELGCTAAFCEWLYDEERNGAGALMDYCCYGAVLARVLLGMPESVHGVSIRTGLKPDLKLEDNAILVLQYPHALATTEASWTQIGKLTSYGTVLYGSEGTLVVEPNHGGKLTLATADCPDGQDVPLSEPDPRLENASLHFLAAIEDRDFPIHPLCTMQNGRDAQWILEQGKHSAGFTPVTE